MPRSSANAIRIDTEELSDGPSAGKAKELVPVLPVRDSVYFPHQVFPLFLGRKKSIQALESASESGKSLLLLTQKSPDAEDPGIDDLYQLGVLVETRQILRVPDGTARATLAAVSRARVNRVVETEPFMQAEITVIQDTTDDNPDLEAVSRTVAYLFEQVVRNQNPESPAGMIPPEILLGVTGKDDAGEIADFIAPHLPLKLRIKQDLLETVDVLERLEKLNVVLVKELEVLDVQREVRARVEKEVGGSQRDYILREQLKAIQHELGAEEASLSESDDYKSQIEQSAMPEDIAAKALKEIDKLDRMPYASPEGAVIRNYLDWLVSMPWGVGTEDRLDLVEAEQLLDAEHYGLQKAKGRILEYLAVRKLSTELKGPILCFVGPPGVGKTSIGKSIAHSLGRKFCRLSLGGIRDEAEIRGHRRTYVGAMPGRIIQGIKQVGTNNPVFMLDEIDKLGKDFRGDPSSALLEALDPEQNDSFTDNYLEAPFNLRNVMFITTANMLDTIPPALADRMEIIRFSGYIEEEKVQIALRFLVPKQIKENGLSERLIKIDEASIRLIIRRYTREAGVRELERLIGAICRKVAVGVAKGKTTCIKIKQTSVPTYLGKPKFRYGRAEETDRVAVATGLVYTEVGGDIVSVEAVPMTSEKSNLTLTGQLGDVMKESAQASLTYIHSRYELLGLQESMFSRLDLHIHVPAGAIPKDGPSAGVTLACAIASALTNRKIRGDIAMTGEITLTGRVLPVGGVKEKVIAAHRSGIRIVILPEENEADLDDLPKNIRADMTIELVTHADQVLAFALRDSDS